MYRSVSGCGGPTLVSVYLCLYRGVGVLCGEVTVGPGFCVSVCIGVWGSYMVR